MRKKTKGKGVTVIIKKGRVQQKKKKVTNQGLVTNS